MSEQTVCVKVVPTPSAGGADSNGVVALESLVAVHRARADLFVGQCHDGAPGRVMGGQVAAQALAAAGGTVEPDRAAHSLHGYFLREGRPDRDIEYRVRRNRDGGSYSARQVSAVQDGAEIFVLAASFARAGAGHDRQLLAPPVPGPDTAPDVYDVWGAQHPEAREGAVYADAADVRIVPRPTGPTPPGPDGAVRQDVWLRSRALLPDDPLVHACALTYLSDVTLAQASGAEHDLIYTLHPGRPRVGLASIDHALWFHRPLRADHWILLRQSSTSASAGRGYNTGTFWSPDGAMAASVAQESVVRLLPARTDKHDGRPTQARADQER